MKLALSQTFHAQAQKKPQGSSFSQKFMAVVLAACAVVAMGNEITSHKNKAAENVISSPQDVLALRNIILPALLEAPRVTEEKIIVPIQKEAVSPAPAATKITAAPVMTPALQPLKKAVHDASAATGIDEQYLWNLSSAETSHRPRRAKGSTADGPFQFLDQTWMRVLVQHGKTTKHGPAIEKHIVARSTVDKNGRYRTKYSIPDKKQRYFIMHTLRYDPAFSALMAAEFSRKNLGVLRAELGREVNTTDLYLAHFMGTNGAVLFLQEKHDDPSQLTADVLQAAARPAANKPLFYSKNSAREKIKKVTLNDTYKLFKKKMPAKPVVMGKPESAPLQTLALR
jgi:hypothetical protein